MNLEIYTDGAYSSSRKQMGIGIVIINNGNKVLEFSKKYGGGTNNQAELGAIIIALRMLKDNTCSVIVYSDSMYCIGCITLGWKRKKNSLLWKEFDEQLSRLEGINIEFKHVKGHSDSYWNNYVNDLAVKASQLI